ncbi:MAG: N-formylglutamate amidohydrolase [Sphingomonas sp.]|nr:N-formylglutamate amidohydrolase [Sphingomonas sp.]
MQMGHYPSPTVHPPRCALPVLLSVPHAGHVYDAATLANAAQGKRALESLEDPLIDRLAWRAIALGIGAVVQPVPRAVIDCNRDEDEVDPAAISGLDPAPLGPRARFGLGLVASRTTRHGALWRQPIDRDQLHLRLAQVHRPYHRAIEQALDALLVSGGQALLLDCHSMPPRPRHQAQLIIGDRHGASAAGWVGAEAARIARSHGFRVAMNEPYAGGAIVKRHGRPKEGLHALQLEIDRSAYLAPDHRSAGPGFNRVASLIEALASGLGQLMLDRGFREAAE